MKTRLNWLRTLVGIPSNMSADGTIPGESAALTPVRAREAKLLGMASELGAEAGLLAVALDPAIERLQADVAAAAQELFDAEESAALATQEQAIVTELTALRAAAEALPAPAFTPARPLPEPLVARRARLVIAAVSGVACVGAALQAAGLIAWLGWVVLTAGAAFALSVAPEAGDAIRRLAHAFRAWRTSRRIRIATASAEARRRALQELEAQGLATIRRRDAWAELTGRRALAELRLQQDRGIHARSLAR